MFFQWFTINYIYHNNKNAIINLISQKDNYKISKRNNEFDRLNENYNDL